MRTKPEYGTQYSDINVLCPFYTGANDEKKFVICEGMDPGTKVQYQLRARARYDEHRRKHCEGDYQSCGYYRAAYEKYEAEGA